MKETILSSSEKSFILNAISGNTRLDGRALDEFRDLKIYFGSDWGCVLVTLGETKVIAQVSCDIQQPKSTRPNEGLLLLFVELSPMAAPHFETGRQMDLAVQLNRLLEKCIKDSHCVDLESLCIAAEEKVWAVRVDVNVLNHAGNLIEAASVAALTALSHFRRLDVTTTGEQISIHTPAERDPLPITLHHHPVCVSYAIFDQGNYVLADPTVIEERVSDGQLVFGVNSSRELCTIHLGGHATVTTPLILRFASRAAERALEVVTRIKEALKEDLEKRNSGIDIGFKKYIEGDNCLSLRKENFCIQLGSQSLDERVENMIKREITEKDSKESCNSGPVVLPLGGGSAELINRKPQTMKFERRQRLYHSFNRDEEGSNDSSESSSSEIISDSSEECEDTEYVEELVSKLEEQAIQELEEEGSRSIEKKTTGKERREEEGETENWDDAESNNRSLKTPEERSPKEKRSYGTKPSRSRGWYSKPVW